MHIHIIHQFSRATLAEHLNHEAGVRFGVALWFRSVSGQDMGKAALFLRHAKKTEGFQYQRIDIVSADSGDTFVLSQDVIVPANQIGVDHELVLITEHSPALIEYCHIRVVAY